MGVSSRIRWCLAAAVLACGLGCSSDGLHRVQGKVLLADGRATEGAVVTFHPRGADPVQAQRPSAIVAADGTFSLTTGTQQGAPAGDYVVTVVWPGDPPAAKSKGTISTNVDEPDRPDRLGGRYADVKTSTLRATVRPGNNQLSPFEVR